MRALIKILSVSFLICSVFFVFSDVVTATGADDVKSLNILFVGFDDSPSNTDVLCVLSCNSEDNTLRAIQIPRDTSVSYGDKNGKINGYYSHCVLKGNSKEKALELLTDKVCGLLGVKIDGYFALTTTGFIEFVDYIGGINIAVSDIPKPLQSEYQTENGNVYLDGTSALGFVRYRKDYHRGDLDRLDAQKVFAKAVFSVMKDRRDAYSLFRFITDNEGISFDINKRRVLSYAMRNAFKTSDADFQIATLPGNAIKRDGLWYYLIDREKAESLTKTYFARSYCGFDLKNEFIYN